MGTRLILVMFCALSITSCSASLHTIYRDDDRAVLKELENGDRVECQKAYSDWDGQDWTDFYSAPCQVFIKRRVKDVYEKHSSN